MSEPEVMLWSRLRGCGGDHPTFRRQHPLGPFIVDFYCPACRLAIEVDGSAHGDTVLQNEVRDRWLQNRGVTVMRAPAGAIYRDLGKVVAGVMARATELGARRFAPSTIGSSLRSADGPPPAIASAMGEIGN